MIDEKEIKSSIPNTNGLSLLNIHNRIINLAHVTEIVFNQNEKFSITIKFLNNTENTQSFENRAYFALSQATLLYCIQNNLFDITLTEETHNKYSGYASNMQKNG